MRTLRRCLFGPLAAFFVVLCVPALAQENPFNPAGTGSVSLSTSNVTSNVALPANTPTALVCNTGTVNVFVRFGASNAITATTSNFILLPGFCQTFNVASQTYMAGITSSGTATVWLTQGRGEAAASAAALGASGLPSGAATAANQTATQAPVAPATATATKSDLLGAQATTGAVNPTNGQQSALSSDTNNNLLVSAGGAPNIATSQASVTTGNISVASARALRRAITITNVTGTGPAYCGNTGVTTSTGAYLGATAGSSITLNTTAAVFCTVASTTQTVTAAETY